MKILVIQQKRIGDVLTSTILCDNLRKEYPQAQIHYMCYPNSTAVLVGHPSVDKIIELPNSIRKSYPKLAQFIWQIRKENYDAVIDAYSKLETNLISFFSGAKYKISYEKGYSNAFYTHNVRRKPNGSKSQLGLAIENRLLLLEPLIAKEKITEYKPKIHLTAQEISGATALLAQHGITEKKRPLVMFGIIGSEWYKTYPLDKMAQLIDHTVAVLDADILFNYIPSQKEDAQKVLDFCQPATRERIHFELYATGLRNFLALLSHCDVLIGNEGGSVNMAKALSVPTFSLFSPSVDKETWQIFEDEKENVSIHLKDLRPELYEEFTEKQIKERTFEFFEMYPIEQIKAKLDAYFHDLGLLKA